MHAAISTLRSNSSTTSVSSSAESASSPLDCTDCTIRADPTWIAYAEDEEVIDIERVITATGFTIITEYDDVARLLISSPQLQLLREVYLAFSKP